MFKIYLVICEDSFRVAIYVYLSTYKLTSVHRHKEYIEDSFRVAIYVYLSTYKHTSVHRNKEYIDLRATNDPL